MEKTFVVPRDSRLQIGLSKGYEANIVASGLLLLPIKVALASYDLETCTLVVRYPKGIHVDVLPPEQHRLPFYADTNDAIYTRLFLDRPAGKGIVLMGNEATIVDDLMASLEQKWVVQPLWGNASEPGMRFFIACYNTIDIIRTEISNKFTAHDPTSIPQHMMALLTCLDDALPDKEVALREMALKLRNIVDLFSWYEKKLLTDDAHERLKSLLAKIKTKQDLVEAKQRNAAGACHSVEIIRNALEDKMGKEWTETFFDGLLKQSQLKKTKKTLSDVFDTYKDEEAFPELYKALFDKHWPDLPIHACHCGHRPKMLKKTIASADGPKSIYLIRCSSCNRQTKRDDWGLPYQVAAVWAKHNGHYDISTAPSIYQLESRNTHEIYRLLKTMNTLRAKIQNDVKALPHGNDEGVDRVLYRLQEITVWNAYIKAALKQGR